jgi:rhodanese-related sulfurtransferase
MVMRMKVGAQRRTAKQESSVDAMSTFMFMAVVSLPFIVALSGCTGSQSAPQVQVATEYGLGPDKWASAWLMSRHAVRGAELAVAMPGERLATGIAFDVPESKLRRQGDRTSFQAVLDAYPSRDPDIAQMAQIVHDIEVNYWSGGDNAESPVVERVYRGLQQRHGRYAVAPECYLAFFDRVHAAVRAKRIQNIAVAPEALDVDCHALATQKAQGDLVPELPIATLLTEMKNGKTVTFVDVREPDEFVEAHIPGAINVPLRALDADVVRRLQGVDYVVSYCIKDFRGFEMARSLRDAGVKNTVILDPYGIRGWVAEGLPTSGKKAMSVAAAQERLERCMAAPERCREDAKAEAIAKKAEARSK